MGIIVKTAIRQERRIKNIERTLNDSDRDSFLAEIDEAPKYVYSQGYVWNVLHRWEHNYDKQS